MSLRQKVISGVKWNSVHVVAGQILNFGTTMVLARILTPADFGLLGMIMIVINFGFNFSSLGMSNAIIQRKEVPDQHLSTFFWLNNIIGIIIFLIVLIIRYPVAWYFQEPLIAKYLVYSACIFLIIPSTQLFHTLLTKELRFKPQILIDISITVIYAASAITLAFFNFGVLSIVFGQIICNVFSVIFYFIYFRKIWLPKFYFNFKEIKSYLSFGAFQMCDRIINYLAANVDYLIIGRLLGAQALGYYTLAFNLITMPLEKITPIILNVAFPTFSKIQDDHDLLESTYCKITHVILFMVFPVFVGLCIVAPDFVRVAYGDQWIPAIPALQILCFVGIIRAVFSPFKPLLLAKGRADIGFYLSILSLCCTAVGLLFFVKWGIIGVAVGLLIINFLLRGLIISLISKIGNLSLLKIIRTFLYPSIATIIMAIFVIFAMHLMKELSIYIRLFASAGTGAGIYYLVYFLIDKSMIGELRSFIKGK